MSSFLQSFQSEIIKTKRSSSFWLSLIGAAFIPCIFFIAYMVKGKSAAASMSEHPWETHLFNGWQALSTFLLPMFIILICSLIVQIEYKNNAWKQVFASPQSTGNIFLSKYLSIHFMILFCFLMFSVFMIAVALLSNLINHEFTFFSSKIDIESILKLNFKTYVSVLGISAIQYWLSLRFKNFIIPLGIGLAFLVSAIIAIGFGWEHVFRHPYASPTLTLSWYLKSARPLLENHEWNSIIVFIVISTLAFLDLRYKKERG